MFVAKLIIMAKDEEECLKKNHYNNFFNKANVMSANIRINEEIPRVKVYSWDDNNINDYEAFHNFFKFFPIMQTYAFVISINDIDEKKGKGLLENAIEIRKTAVLTSNPICAKIA